jgi:hypothetical protein
MNTDGRGFFSERNFAIAENAENTKKPSTLNPQPSTFTKSGTPGSIDQISDPDQGFLTT